MDEPSSSTSLSDAQDLPEWANWPLRPDGKLDTERLMPTTFLVCSKEYCKSRQDLSASLPSLAPKREKQETKSNPIISNLTLLELYDLSGEEIIEFRTFVLETLGEFDRINNREKLMNDHAAIRRSMTELRKVAAEISLKNTREESTVFLRKPANLAILGYFTRRDPRNQTSLIQSRVNQRQFKEFTLGNKGSARVSIYNWRHKQWGESVNRNLSIKPEHVVKTKKENSSVMPRLEANEDVSHSDIMDERDTTIESAPPISPEKPSDIRPTSPSDSKKLKIEDGFNLKNAIVKGRDEVNFYCSVKANKVNPGGFGLPKGFIKCGDMIVHHTKSDKVDMNGVKKRRWKPKEEVKRMENKDRLMKAGIKRKIARESADKSHPTSPVNENGQLNESGESEVVMDDIEDDENEMTDDIDVCGGKAPVFTTESSSQTDDTVDIMRTANGDTVINPEIASQLKMLEATHSEDMGIIQKLRVENVVAVKNLSKYYNRCVSLMMDRNNIKCTFNAVDKERKSEKTMNGQLAKQVRHLSHQNTMLNDEVNTLKREIAIRDQLYDSNREVGRYEEYSG